MLTMKKQASNIAPLPRRKFIKHVSLGVVGLYSQILGAKSIPVSPKSILANSYYVSDSEGNDNNSGTLAQPFKTIQKAADVVQADDTVFIKAGVYNERILLTTSGTPTQPINFIGFETGVVIDGSNLNWNPPNAINPSNGLLDMYGVAYVNLENLSIASSSYAGFYMENCNNITIKSCKTNNTVSSGIGVWSCDNIIVDGNTIQRACNGGGEECITVAETANSIVKNNEVFNNIGGDLGGEGIDIKQGSHDVKVFNNHVHNLNGRLGIYVDAYDQFTHNIEVYNNLVHDITESGIAVASESGGLLEDVFIYNNVVYSNTFGGIEVGGWITVAGTTSTPINNIKIINNTLYDNGDSINVDNAFADNILLHNNICSENRGLQIVVDRTPISKVMIQNNLIQGNHDLIGSQAVLSDPLFEDLANKDFHLKINSPAINAGTTINAPLFDFDNNDRTENGLPDIGALENIDQIFKHGFE
jgi:hypothetical protein